MANREELLIIRAARAGQASAQVTLGKRYLFGGAGLPKSLPTALYWLDRAARQDEPDAWMLIGSHVPYEIVQQTAQPARLTVWYERAFDAGVAQAGLVLARLVLGQAPGAVSEAMRSKALRALQVAAHAGLAQAQWLLAQYLGRADAAALRAWPADAAAQATDNEAMLEWARRAARSGVREAQCALAEHAWASGDRAAFLQWAPPLARHIVEGARAAASPAAESDISLVLRCAHALLQEGASAAAEAVRLLEFAAKSGAVEAQLMLGLWHARMDARGARVPTMPGMANYKKAIRWLQLAAEQGSPDAGYVLSRIYLKPECSRRNLAAARRHLASAAQAGHRLAQLELGMVLWRARHEQEANDVLAVGWLQKARAQGVAEAGKLLQKIAAPPGPAPWAQSMLQRLPPEIGARHPLLAARLRLAAQFGLSRTEALLIDLKTADRGGCLVVDVRAYHPHSKRRLIDIQSAGERQALDRIAAVFARADGATAGAEENYRQRLCRLKALARE